jgi:hypothetical protein
MVDIQTVSIAVASASVLAGVIYYIIEIRHQSKLRQTESLFRLSPWFNMNAREMQEAITSTCSIEYKNYEDYLRKYSERPEHMAMKILGNYFEGIGILVNKKLVDAEIVHAFWGDIILSSWEQIKPLIADMRRDSGDMNMFVFWEHLYDEMKKRQ